MNNLLLSGLWSYFGQNWPEFHWCAWEVRLYQVGCVSQGRAMDAGKESSEERAPDTENNDDIKDIAFE